MEPAPQSAEDAVWHARCAALSRAWVQVRYQRRRQQAFDLFDKGTKSLTVLLGASLFGQAVQQWLPQVAGLISALGLLALVFGYSDRKQLHKELAEGFANVIADIEAVPAGELTAGKVASWHAAHARLVAKAPPPLKTLTLVCEREQAAADGYPDHVPEQPRLARFVADFF